MDDVVHRAAQTLVVARCGAGGRCDGIDGCRCHGLSRSRHKTKLTVDVRLLMLRSNKRDHVRCNAKFEIRTEQATGVGLKHVKGRANEDMVLTAQQRHCVRLLASPIVLDFIANEGHRAYRRFDVSSSYASI